MQRATKLWTVLLLACFAACEDPKDTRQLSSADDADVEQLATTPAPVTGSYLRCAYLDDPNAVGTTAVGCNPYDEDDKIIDLDVAGSDPRWSFESRLLVTFTKNYIDAKGFRWQGRFDFAGTEVIDRNLQILETKITLSYIQESSGQPITLQDKIRNLLMGLADHRYIKIAYESIHMNPPSVSGLFADTVNFEFKIDGVWEQVVIKLETLDLVAQTMKSDRFSFHFKGSEVDWKMYLGTGMGRELANILASTRPDFLKWNMAIGSGWAFDAGSSFQNVEPFDLKDKTKPIELVIDLGIKKRFHGIRIDGGKANPGRSLPNGFPDRFHFLYSDDNLNWTKIKSSEVTLDSRSNLEWSWDQ